MAAPALAQFASGVSLVEVYATVTDARGEPVGGLPRDTFIVEEDGHRQEIRAFASGDVPLSLAVALDRSFSMTDDRLAYAANAVQHLLRELRPSDQVMLLGIGSEVEPLVPLSVDHRAVYDALNGLTRWGTTPLFDATVAAVSAIQQGTGRRALILITDGSNRYSSVEAGEMMARVRVQDVLVYTVTLQRVQPPVFVEFAAATGARSFAVSDVRSIAPTLSGIARELRQQYLLGYTPSVPPGPRASWRSITVRSTRPDLRVRARAGYEAR